MQSQGMVCPNYLSCNLQATGADNVANSGDGNTITVK